MRQLLVATMLFAGFASVASGQVGFTTKIYSNPYSQSELVAADFNHDGYPDLLSFGGGGAIFFNDGHGGFLAPTLLPNPAAGHLKITDVNGDGALDIVGCAANAVTGAPEIVTYLNNGAGSFTVLQEITIPNCGDVAVGDANRDGHPDVVVATSAMNNSLFTLFGSASGKLSPPVIQQNILLDDPADPSGIYVGCPLDNITAGDFYHDGNLSLILNASCYFGPVEAGTTTLAESDGTGHYTLASVAPHFGFQYNGTASDVNRDGLTDAVLLVSACCHGTPSIAYQQNLGGGILQESDLGYSLGSNNGSGVQRFSGVAIADLNDDGYNDIATSFTADYNSNYLPAISILTGSFGFPELQHWLLGSDGVGGIAAADFNQDGRPDLAVVLFEQATNTSNLIVYTNNPSASSCGVPDPRVAYAVICTPVKGTTVSPHFNVSAASNLPNLTLNSLYLDNKVVFQTTAPSINTPITAADGDHTLTLVTNTANGYTNRTSTTFTSGPSVRSCAPASAEVKICAPASTGTVPSPVVINAGVTAQSGYITAIRAYIDNVAVLTVNNPAATKSFEINQAIIVAAGSHQLTIVGYQSTGGALTKTQGFTTDLSGPCYPSAPGVKFCSPPPNSVIPAYSSNVIVSFGATASSGYLVQLVFYVNGSYQTSAFNPQRTKSFAMQMPFFAAPGPYTLTVVGSTSTGRTLTASEVITSQ